MHLVYQNRGRPRWLSWTRRPTEDQEVAGSTPAEVGNILSWRLIMKNFLGHSLPSADSRRAVETSLFPNLTVDLINPPPRSGWGLIEMAFVCPFFHNFLVRSISPGPFERFSLNFGQMFASVSGCAEPMSAIPTHGHRSRSWV